jgi:predicted NAD-dependent protein-ADP-ribosyltransferase YbiA (DUF1768 family)
MMFQQNNGFQAPMQNGFGGMVPGPAQIDFSAFAAMAAAQQQTQPPVSMPFGGQVVSSVATQPPPQMEVIYFSNVTDAEYGPLMLEFPTPFKGTISGQAYHSAQHCVLIYLAGACKDDNARQTLLKYESQVPLVNEQGFNWPAVMQMKQDLDGIARTIQIPPSVNFEETIKAALHNALAYKFLQSPPAFHDLLMKTERKSLVAAIPGDVVFGTGFDENQTKVADPKMVGKNLLGHGLMQIRSMLRHHSRDQLKEYWEMKAPVQGVDSTQRPIPNIVPENTQQKPIETAPVPLPPVIEPAQVPVSEPVTPAADKPTEVEPVVPADKPTEVEQVAEPVAPAEQPTAVAAPPPAQNPLPVDLMNAFGAFD